MVYVAKPAPEEFALLAFWDSRRSRLEVVSLFPLLPERQPKVVYLHNRRILGYSHSRRWVHAESH